MKKSKSLILKAVIFSVIVVGVLLIASCGKMSPTSVDQSAQDQNGSPDYYGNQAVESKWGRIFYWNVVDKVYGMVDQGGGTMTFDNFDYDCSVTFPEGAVDGWISFTAELTGYNTWSGVIYMFQFGPEGTVFNIPVEIVMDAAALTDGDPDCELEGADLWYWDPVRRRWFLIDYDMNVDDGLLSFQLEHFSRYAIGGRLK
jgi:hypothetical protein